MTSGVEGLAILEASEAAEPKALLSFTSKEVL